MLAALLLVLAGGLMLFAGDVSVELSTQHTDTSKKPNDHALPTTGRDTRPLEHAQQQQVLSRGGANSKDKYHGSEALKANMTFASLSRNRSMDLSKGPLKPLAMKVEKPVVGKNSTNFTIGVPQPRLLRKPPDTDSVKQRKSTEASWKYSTPLSAATATLPDIGKNKSNQNYSFTLPAVAAEISETTASINNYSSTIATITTSMSKTFVSPFTRENSSSVDTTSDERHVKETVRELPPSDVPLEEWKRRERKASIYDGSRPERWIVAPGTSASEPYTDRCGDPRSQVPQRGSCRVVSDPTSSEKGVAIIAEKLVLSNAVSDATPPRPIMSGRNGQKFEEHCTAFKSADNWRRSCPSGSAREHDWWKCDVRQFVAKLSCGFVDTDPVIPGMAYDRTRSFPVHGNHPQRTQFQPITLPPRNIKHYKSLSHNLAVYPNPHGGAAHFFNQLPRLLFLLRVLPPDVPILLSMHDAQRSMLNVLASRDLIDLKRVVPWDVGTTYHADSKPPSPTLLIAFLAPDEFLTLICITSPITALYFAGELGYGKSTSMKWDSLRVEHCSWALALPRTELQQVFTSSFVQRETRPVVMVVSRRDAGKRRNVMNHASIMQKLQDALPNCTIREFVGRDHDLNSTILLWTEADVVVAPHGAALAFMTFMRPGRAVIEIGYDNYDSRGMTFPLSYFMSIAASVGLRYYLSIARGGYSSSLRADVEDIVSLVQLALRQVTLDI